MPSTIMVDPIRYVGFWNWRTSNCQVPQNPNVLSDRPIRRFRHNDVSLARRVQEVRARAHVGGPRSGCRTANKSARSIAHIDR